ncbi:tetratricopeptide repeat protein [Glaciecola sp. KUL10]|uniref:YfgM family protein n=1 Tax=Glaciecola sp. (strain KUL10) TaxID=2161813 RepID=UPI000D789FF4|nr:tetratricopeptide repeat protein [Glaciecola sp. KUL10]GBL04746.1 membrane-associated protein with TPR-like domain [Glaciecola sp. KUL10]
MERYETEEQQVEAIKAFWKTNGTAIILGAVIGLGGLWGWRYYNDAQLENKAQASFAYNKIVESVSAGETQTNTQLQSFISEHNGTGYAALAALIAAQQLVISDDLEAAQASLQDAINLAKSDAISDLAKLRLARVQAAREQFSVALTTLDSVINTSFKDQVEEIKGDIYLAQKDFDSAKIAYANVLTNNENNRDVAIKMSNLAYAATQVVGDSSED